MIGKKTFKSSRFLPPFNKRKKQSFVPTIGEGKVGRGGRGGGERGEGEGERGEGNMFTVSSLQVFNSLRRIKRYWNILTIGEE
jgi:hypothetical protein